ncbi:hypothetical protein CR513_19288, partial [Mucuna pruriens]
MTHCYIGDVLIAIKFDHLGNLTGELKSFVATQARRHVRIVYTNWDHYLLYIIGEYEFPMLVSVGEDLRLNLVPTTYMENIRINLHCQLIVSYQRLIEKRKKGKEIQVKNLYPHILSCGDESKGVEVDASLVDIACHELWKRVQLKLLGNYTSDFSKEVIEEILRRAHREPFFPMALRISSPLPLGNQSTLVMFGLLDKVGGFSSILEHIYTMHSPQQLSPMTNW